MKIYLHKNENPINLIDIETSFFSGTIVDEPIDFSKEIKSGSHIVNMGDFGLTNFSLIDFIIPFPRNCCPNHWWAHQCIADLALYERSVHLRL